MAGWPWPLDGVQAWFEGLWDWILEACNSAVSIVEGWVKAAADGLWNLIQNPIGTIIGLFTWLWDTIGPWITGAAEWIVARVTEIVTGISSGLSSVGQWMGDQLSGGLTWLQNAISGLGGQISSYLGGLVSTITGAFQTVGSWIASVIYGWVDGSLKWLSDTFNVLFKFIDNTGSYIISEVTSAFDGAFAGFTDLLTPLSDILLGVFKGIWEWIQGLVSLSGSPTEWTSLRAALDGLPAARAGLGAGGLPPSPQTAWEQLEKARDEGQGHFDKLQTGMAALEAFTMGMLDVNIAGFMNGPKVKAWTGLATEVYLMEWEVGLIPLAQQELRKKWLPSLPGPGDLVRMVVREAFDPNVVVKAPEIFSEKMMLAGFAPEWSDRYWTAHFEPIALRQAYDNLWRGYWDKDKFLYALHIADIHPMWREDIYNVAFRPLSRRELRYGWEVGEVSEEKMIAAFRALGLSPEDAEIAMRASVEYALSEERNKVLNEWLTDFQEGLMNEATLKANMDAIKIIGARQDYYVAKATIRRERDQTKDMLHIYRDAYIKDMISEDDLRARASELLVDPDAIEIYYSLAYIDKYKKPPAPKETQVKEASLTYLAQAFREGLMAEADFRLELASRGYGPEERDVIVAVEKIKMAQAEERERKAAVPPAPEELKLASLTYLTNAFRMGLIDEATLRSELALRKYALDQIDMIVAVEKLKIKEAEERAAAG